MTEKKKIAIILSGGTIDADPYHKTPKKVENKENKSRVKFYIKYLQQKYPQAFDDFEIDIIKKPKKLKDSQDITDDEISEISDTAADKQYHAALLVTGTDAAERIADKINQNLNGELNKPIMMVGAMLPLSHGFSDKAKKQFNQKQEPQELSEKDFKEVQTRKQVLEIYEGEEENIIFHGSDGFNNFKLAMASLLKGLEEKFSQRLSGNDKKKLDRVEAAPDNEISYASHGKIYRKDFKKLSDLKKFISSKVLEKISLKADPQADNDKDKNTKYQDLVLNQSNLNKYTYR